MEESINIHLLLFYCKIDFAKRTNFKNARKKERPDLEDRILFSEDCSDEVVYAGIDEVIAVFIFGCDRVVRAIELCIEAGLVGVQKGLFFRRKFLKKTAKQLQGGFL